MDVTPGQAPGGTLPERGPPDQLPQVLARVVPSGGVSVTLVEPSLGVEVSDDTAFEHGRWRHLTRFVRPRPDLSPAEVVPPV